MALTTVDFNTYFNYKESTKQITFTDKTDFVGQGTTTSNVTVVAKVVAPISGTIYNNTNHGSPDIDPNTSLDSVITIPLPLDAGGLPELGTYTITLTYQDLVVGPATVVETRTFTLAHVSPTVDITMSVDCITPLLSAVDSSSYTVASVDPTIVRDFKIHYPPSLSLADVTGTAGTLTTKVFYTVADQTVEHSSSLTSTLTYLMNAPDSMYVIDEVTGSEVVAVACDGDICDIYCCIRSQYLRWQSARNMNATLAQIELDKFVQITSIAEMVGEALRCNKNAHISDYVAKILEIAECDAGCACADGTPTLVTGLAVTGDTIVVDAGTGITVSSVSGGGTTTYTVALSSTNVTKLANMRNAVVAAGTNVTSVTTADATVGGILERTFTVNATDTFIPSLFARVTMTMNAAAVPGYAITTQSETGTTFQAIAQGIGADFITNNNAGSFGDWTSKLTDFTIDNFFASATDYFPEVMVANITKSTAGDKSSWLNDLRADIVSMSASSFDIRFSDSSGNPVNGLHLQDYATIDLIFKLQV
jgi:hypothetical protein